MSSPDKGHFTVTASVQLEALTTFMVLLVGELDEKRVVELMKELDAVDKRYRPIVQVIFKHIAEKMPEEFKETEE